MLETINLTLGYPSGSDFHKVLQEVNLTVQKGQLVSLIGMNGSGKSTLLRSMVRLIVPVSGQIKIQGMNIQDIHPAELARMVSFAAAGKYEGADMKISELVSMGRYPYTGWYGKPRDEDIRQISAAMEQTGIHSLAGMSLSSVSDGERQKAIIARVIAQNTPIVLLDEPAAFLDAPARSEISLLLRNLADLGKTVLFSSHDIDLAMKVSDLMVITRNGRIITGIPEDLALNAQLEVFFPGEIKRTRKLWDLPVQLITHPGAEPAGRWTVCALDRCGIPFHEEKSRSSGVVAEIFKKNNQYIWNLRSDKENLSFTSIEQLIGQLKSN